MVQSAKGWLEISQVRPKTAKVSLPLSQVEMSMLGNYTCKPYNSWGTAGTSGVIGVVVEKEEEETEEAEEEEEEDPLVAGLPRLIGAWVDHLEVEVGQEVRLECRAEGEPAPEVFSPENTV